MSRYHGAGHEHRLPHLAIIGGQHAGTGPKCARRTFAVHANTYAAPTVRAMLLDFRYVVGDVIYLPHIPVFHFARQRHLETLPNLVREDLPIAPRIVRRRAHRR